MRSPTVLVASGFAGYTQEAGVSLFAQLRENLRRHFAGESLLTPVDETVMPSQSSSR